VESQKIELPHKGENRKKTQSKKNLSEPLTAGSTPLRWFKLTAGINGILPACGGPLRAPESAHQQWGESPHRTEHWLSVVEGNCVVERRGGRQPETNCQSINKTMLNTIRPDALASLRRVSEAQNRTPTRKGQGNFGDLSSGETVSAGEGMHGVGGDRMAGSWSDMNQGSLFGKGTAFMTDERSEEPYPKGDRAFVRAKKRGNARGAKGGRKVEA